ncbi:MAG: ABC transporter permease [Candidatus Aminicenantes bacterium]|nr:ABC transporter permease [Candidatus Aminicenantes bacterium]
MAFEFFIARRYLTARRKQAFISVITLISILGIAIGVAALIIAISLITGFQGDVQDKILGATSHLMVSDITGEGLRDYERTADLVRGVDGVVSVTPVVYNMALFSGLGRNAGGVLKGIDFESEAKTARWLSDLHMGRLPDPERDGAREGVLIGRELALQLGAAAGDVLTVYTSAARLTPIGQVPKLKRFLVTGIFSAGLYEFDSTTAFISHEAAQKLFDLEERTSYLQVTIRDIFQASRLAGEISRLLPPSAYVTTWMDLNRSLFSALKLEKTILFLTITLIVFVAALNIIATLILMVMEKTRDIGILLAMGATPVSIRRVFFLQGAMIGVIGTAAGTALGLLWNWLANTFQLIHIPVDIYQISFVPFRLRITDLAVIVGVSLLISFASTLFPSYRAARVDPMTALKYE